MHLPVIRMLITFVIQKLFLFLLPFKYYIEFSKASCKFSVNIMNQFAKETLPVSLEDEMKKSYLDYAMSVIVARAIPDACDGLKP